MSLSRSFPFGLILAVSASLCALGCNSSPSAPCDNKCNASTEKCVNNACVDNCSLCQAPAQACVNHACVANACPSCTAAQTCVNNACVATCSLCKDTERCENDTCVPCPTGQTVNQYGLCEASCSGNENGCAEAHACIGGPRYTSIGNFSTNPPTVLLASDDPAAYCSPRCPLGTECDAQSRCVTLPRYGKVDGKLNNYPDQVCIRNDYCAPAESLADCYPYFNAAFFKDTDGNGFCTTTCESVGDCPGDAACINGHCEPRSGSCKTTGELCAPCLSVDSCPGYCFYSPLSGVRLCEPQGCDCTGHEITTKSLGGSYSDPLGTMTAVYCTGAATCPDLTPGGAPAGCQTLAKVENVQDPQGNWSVKYTYSARPGLCAPVSALISGATPSCYPPQP